MTLFGPSAFGQSYGLKFAYPSTDALQFSATSPNLSYSIHSRVPEFGITGELGLPGGFNLEIDALYSRMSYSSRSMGVDVLTRSSTTINNWDFPVLLKKPLSRKLIRPFVNAGAAFRAVNEDTNANTIVFPSNVTQTRMRAIEYIHQGTAGTAAGAGIDFRIGKVHVVPEFRYTRFQRENFRAPIGNFHSNLSQSLFLLGLEKGR